MMSKRIEHEPSIKLLKATKRRMGETRNILTEQKSISTNKTWCKHGIWWLIDFSMNPMLWKVKNKKAFQSKANRPLANRLGGSPSEQVWTGLVGHRSPCSRGGARCGKRMRLGAHDVTYHRGTPLPVNRMTDTRLETLPFHRLRLRVVLICRDGIYSEGLIKNRWEIFKLPKTIKSILKWLFFTFCYFNELCSHMTGMNLTCRIIVPKDRNLFLIM